MDTTIWIILGATAGAVVLYLLVMRVFYRQSRELDRQVDKSKLKPWVDDEK